MEIIFLIVGLVLGIIIGFLVKSAKSSDTNIVPLEKENSTLRTKLEAAENKEQQLIAAQEELLFLSGQLTEWRVKFENEQRKSEEQSTAVETMQKKLEDQFTLIANKVLDQNSSKLQVEQEKNMQKILDPFKTQITQFEEAIQKRYEKEAAARNVLKGEINHLVEMNRQIGIEAHNLTNALKGDSKAQGNWGELILEKVLKHSGLQDGIEYETQAHLQNETGESFKPDVIIHLPDNKHVIIDAKVSLTAYEQFVNAETPEEGNTHLKHHLVSIKKHIKSLSEKDYHHLIGLQSPEFVLMFIPIESSFSITLKEDNELYNYAWKHRVVIVSPSTLLATLRTIASVWKQDRQNKNAEEIARQAGALYDKFHGFIVDMEKIKKGIDTSNSAYSDAINKLSKGNGNLVRSTEKLKALGLKTKKEIDDKYLED